MVESPLWTVEELIKATSGHLEGTPVQPMNGVSIDSRAILPGDVFAAIKGDRLDGHEFAEAALKAGAGLAIVARPTDAMRKAGPLLIVKDVLTALEEMGRWARNRSCAKIVGVTGSVGKTSTKEMLKLALSASGDTHASSASFNNHWGVPLSLSRMRRETAYGVFEIGMNHAGEITPLTRMVRPHVAIVTAIAASHLGHFNSLDEIADAKAEIFLGLDPSGMAVINRDTPYFDRLASAARAAGVSQIVSFGSDTQADVRIENIAAFENFSCITANVLGETVIYKLGVPGQHMAVNSLAVLAAVKLMGADLARASLALAAAEPAKGRGVRTRLRLPEGDITLIDESYNANPASMRAAFSLLGQSNAGKNGRRIAVLGDMLELGDQGPELHAELAGPLAECKIDVIHACGPLMVHLWEKLPASKRGAYAKTSDELRNVMASQLRAGDVVMIKGSLGSRMGPLVDALKARAMPVSKVA
jgi:UDP-N-acetylmuramoyl-tripeptide--D-alanyl-D-alanine ligase